MRVTLMGGAVSERHANGRGSECAGVCVGVYIAVST